MIDKLIKYFNKSVTKAFSENKETFKEKKSNKIKITNSVLDTKLKSIIDINDSTLYGKKATFRLVSKVNVIDLRAVDSSKILFKKDFLIDSASQDVIVDLAEYKNFSYKGNMINIDLIIEFIIDDSIFFDTKVTSKIQEALFVKPHVYSNLEFIIDPKDNFNLKENLKAIPFDAMALVFGLSILGGIVILINTLVGAHDQFVIDAQTYFYSHYNSDGESSSPLFNSLATSGAFGAGIWFMIKSQLRRYMTFLFKETKFLGDIITKYRIKDIVTGNSRVDLKDVVLKIVACNMEKGQYKRGSGTKTRTVSFTNPIRAISLYEEKVDFIPKNTDISEYFKGEVSFENMYKTLYPEQIISSSHGLTIHFEVQLIHNNFIDQELIGNSSFFKYEHFLKG